MAYKKLAIIFLMTVFAALTACDALNSKTAEIYVPPTLAATLVPQTLPIVTVPEATTTPACTNRLVYVDDLSVPDGTQFSSGEAIDKIWLVENSGSCSWDINYRLKLVAGEEMGAGNERMIFPARSGTEAQIQIVFTAPNNSGFYRTVWQAHGPDGEPFGDLIFMEIIVGE